MHRTLLALLWTTTVATAQTFDTKVSPGSNFDKANFRLWLDPDDSGGNRQPPRSLEGLLVLTPGSNSDGRSQVEDAAWQAFAKKHRLALIGAHWTDHRHENMAAEHYVDVRRGSGQAFLDAIAKLAEQAKRPDVATAPLLLWGMSAGGQFNYEFATWKPEQVAAFVVNKGGIYYTVMADPAARQVPGLFCIGADDTPFRNDIIRGLHSVNRRFKAQWALSIEPGIGHQVGQSRALAVAFFEDVLEATRPAGGSKKEPRQRVRYEHGVVANPADGSLQPAKDADSQRPDSWFPGDRSAEAWQQVRNRAPSSRRTKR